VSKQTPGAQVLLVVLTANYRLSMREAITKPEEDMEEQHLYCQSIFIATVPPPWKV